MFFLSQKRVSWWFFDNFMVFRINRSFCDVNDDFRVTSSTLQLDSCLRIVFKNYYRITWGLTLSIFFSSCFLEDVHVLKSVQARHGFPLEVPKTSESFSSLWFMVSWKLADRWRRSRGDIRRSIQNFDSMEMW